jgi:phosphoribosylformylglycinamidine synthase subunit PurL
MQIQFESLGFSAQEWEHFVSQLGRIPTLSEAAACGALWSEHCSYKSTKKHLSRFHSSESWVWQGPGENAGVIEISNEFGIAFKMESHNHPSYLEPYEGAATGVGGILRDIFCMGARPIAAMNCLRFGFPEGSQFTSEKWSKHLVCRVVKGIAGYGNSFGVPTVGGNTAFHEGYSANILVNAFAAGLVQKQKLYKGVLKTKHQNEGSAIIYFGQATGRDGVNGALMSSSEFAHSSGNSGVNLKPTVQVGDPFAGKKLLEATLALIDSGLAVGLQDMGAAGLTSSTVEMAHRSACGVELNLNLVPQRAQNMQPMELLLSESQERMVAAVHPQHVAHVIKLLKTYEIEACEIGSVNQTGNFSCKFDGKTVVNLPVSLMVDGFLRKNYELSSHSEYDFFYAQKQNLNALSFSKTNTTIAQFFVQIKNGLTLAQCLENKEHREIFLHAFGNIHFASRAPLTEMYCSTVQGNTVSGCGALQEADCAIVRVQVENNETLYVSFSSGCEERWVEAHPKYGAAHSVLRVARKNIAAGFRPKGMTDCLNFGSPSQSYVMHQFSNSIDGISFIAKEFQIPVVSGNVSLNNQTAGNAIPPTPMVGIVGVSGSNTFPMKKLFKLQKNYLKQGKKIKLYHIGIQTPVAQFESGLLAWCLSKTTLPLQIPNVSAEKILWNFYLKHCTNFILGLSVGHGGILGTTFKLAFENNVYWDILLKLQNMEIRHLTQEGQMGFVVGCEENFELHEMFKNEELESLICTDLGFLSQNKNQGENQCGNVWDIFLENLSQLYNTKLGETYF